MAEAKHAAELMFAQVAKIVKALTDDQFEALVAGTAKLAFVGAESRVVQYTPTVESAMKHFSRLKDEDIQALDAPGSKLAVLRKGEKVFVPIDIPALADELTRMDTEDQIIRHLAADSRLKPADLTKLAKELGIAAPTGRPKPPMDLHIAQTLIAYRMVTPRGA